jgi:hypothetical protein
MKLKFIIIVLFILQFAFLISDTIIDSVYSDPILDGYIMFSQNAQAYSVNNWMYDMGAGDYGFAIIDPDPNSYVRSYISFYLPEVPDEYHIDSIYVRIYQYDSGGYDASIGEYTDFPVWDVAVGDTIKCIMSHIDYGNELDIGDWEKGDVGNAFTYQNNIGTITENGEEGYRYLDVTSSVIQDYELNRDKTQYRIAFQIDTDWDYESDFVAFLTGSTQSVWARPQVFIRFTDEVNSIENDEIALGQSHNFEIYPNPVNNILGVSLSRKDVFIKKLEIFNIKGQKVKSFNDSNIINNNRISINISKMPSGLYLMKLITDKEETVKKFLIMR